MDTGVVGYVCALFHNWGWSNWNPAHHGTILWITVVLAIQTLGNTIGAAVMGAIARFGVGVEILGTIGIAIILAIHGFHHGLGFLFTTQGVQHASSNPFGVSFGGSWALAARWQCSRGVIFYGFESAGDIAEETKDAGRQIPKAMRHALIWGGVTSLILTARCCRRYRRPIRSERRCPGTLGILGQLSTGMQDFLLILIIFAFFSCGSSVQGAGGRLAFLRPRRRAPRLEVDLACERPLQDAGQRDPRRAVISLAFVFLVYYTPSHDVKIGFITYPASLNALFALISFGVSGIYLSFLLTVIGAMIARRRGWVPEGSFQLGKWGWTVSWIAVVYLGLMLVNVVSQRGVERARPVQLRLDHAGRDGGHRARRSGLLLRRATGSQDLGRVSRARGTAGDSGLVLLRMYGARRQGRPVHLFV